MNTQHLHNFVKAFITITCLIIFSTEGFGNCTYSKPLEAKEVKIGNVLTWETSTEQNNKMFLVQKSNDGKTFENIGEVKSKGNQLSNASYEFLDFSIGSDKAFYRLSQVDEDGSTEFTRTVLINRAMKNNFMIRSMRSAKTDAVFSFTLISHTATRLTYQVRSLDHTSVLEGTFEDIQKENHLDIDLSALPNDEYKILISNDKEIEQVYVRKVSPEEMPNTEFAIKN